MRSTRRGSGADRAKPAGAEAPAAAGPVTPGPAAADPHTVRAVWSGPQDAGATPEQPPAGSGVPGLLGPPRPGRPRLEGPPLSGPHPILAEASTLERYREFWVVFLFGAGAV